MLDWSHKQDRLSLSFCLTLVSPPSNFSCLSVSCFPCARSFSSRPFSSFLHPLVLAHDSDSLPGLRTPSLIPEQTRVHDLILVFCSNSLSVWLRLKIAPCDLAATAPQACSIKRWKVNLNGIKLHVLGLSDPCDPLSRVSKLPRPPRWPPGSDSFSQATSGPCRCPRSTTGWLRQRSPICTRGAAEVGYPQMTSRWVPSLPPLLCWSARGLPVVKPLTWGQVGVFFHGWE